ncbi:prepilin-type N-terminal cleavage/methylation domain-containing protein [bacterium]|nr:prepilin-type N-terminal cleavage/methylation domain-containing protein [bacterium]NBX81494.1 prepilin-type N-terminal cleavage/methylation domain-containing protein [bacterium]
MKNQKGFTLVELMTTVAIVGALAAVGVPQYRKIQRKAKRAESTMALGVIASAEAAFYAEYDGYGTSMGGIGAEMEQAPRNYTVGFLGADCGVVETAANMIYCRRAAACAANTNPNAFPGYTAATIFSPTVADANANRVVSGFSAIQQGAPARANGGMYNVASCPTAMAAAGSGIGFVWSTPPAAGAGITAGISGISDVGFRATAAGNLYERASAPGAIINADVITIDNTRAIRVVQDGT